MPKNKAQGFKTVYRTDDGREFFDEVAAAEHAKTMRVKLYIQSELAPCPAVAESITENRPVIVEHLAEWLADKFNIEVPGDEIEDDEAEDDEIEDDEAEDDEIDETDETDEVDGDKVADDDGIDDEDEEGDGEPMVRIVERADDPKAAEYARSLETVAPKIMALIYEEFRPEEYFDYDDMARIGVAAGAGRKQVNESSFATRLAKGLAHMGLIVRSRSGSKNFLHYETTPRTR